MDIYAKKINPLWPPWPPHSYDFHILTDSLEQAKLNQIHCCQLHWWTSCVYVYVCMYSEFLISMKKKKIEAFHWPTMVTWLVPRPVIGPCAQLFYHLTVNITSKKIWKKKAKKKFNAIIMLSNSCKDHQKNILIKLCLSK